MKKDTSVFIKHILESIERIEEYVKEISEKQFFEETQVQDAIIRRIEIIGEATKNLPNGFRKKHSEVPWNEITGARDKLIHGYFGVDLDLTWDIVKKDLPELKKKVEKILKEIEETKDKK
ncbi:MAG: DUF86 domain-containing protein [Candidatus Aenigmarchaeota archaeon]|nr:DUF86 domain-containing protein [Candidatus Aenigmarchaeota archaeon]